MECEACILAKGSQAVSHARELHLGCDGGRVKKETLRAKQKDKNVEWWEYERLRWECVVIKLCVPLIWLSA
ncbi:hypothetical protein KFK09_007278 [Dendrobium nobile]|uniref:Uncharacterized protein n=1 Tax=Dendrobium nobile TaxID=94219 RepID=A0A8T3BW09_DENNO|nr:hypothetical protein KFK09_007278 [Dendrobium nobile]